MKWKTPSVPLPPWVDGIERKGETRTFKHFAILPVGCSDGTTRWLETVRVHQTWDKIITGFRGTYCWGWTKTIYIPIEKSA